MKLFLIILTALILSACSSAPTHETAETQEDIIISRIDGLDERPEWLQESEPFKIENGEIVSLGSVTIPANQRLSSAKRVALNNAKRGIASAVSQKLEFTFQRSEEDLEYGSEMTRYIGAEMSRLSTSKIRPGKYYYEKIATTQDDGNRITMYRVFHTVTMNENDFKKAVIAAIKSAEGKKHLTSDFHDKVNKQWDSFVEAPVEMKEDETKK